MGNAVQVMRIPTAEIEEDLHKDEGKDPAAAPMGEAGLQLFELLRGAAPGLVDPGTTAEWEMQLDAVVTGRAEFKTVIDGIAAETDKLIAVLQQRSGGAVRIDAPAPKAGRTPRRSRGPRRPAKEACEAKAPPRHHPPNPPTPTPQTPP